MPGLTQRSLMASRPLFKHDFQAEVFPDAFMGTHRGDTDIRGRRKYHDTRQGDSGLHHTLGTQRTRSSTPGPTARAPHNLQEYHNDSAGMRSCRAERPGLLGESRSQRKVVPVPYAKSAAFIIGDRPSDESGFYHFGFMPCSDKRLPKTGQLLFYNDATAHITPSGEVQHRRPSLMQRSASCEPRVQGFRPGRCGPPPGALQHHQSSTDKVTPPFWTFPTGDAGDVWRSTTARASPWHPVGLSGDRAQVTTSSSYSRTSSRSGSRQPEWVMSGGLPDARIAGLASTRTPRGNTSRSREPSRGRMGDLSARSDTAPAGVRPTRDGHGPRAPVAPLHSPTKLSPLGALVPERTLFPRAASCPPARLYYSTPRGSDGGSSARGATPRATPRPTPRATPRDLAPPTPAGASPPAFSEAAGKAVISRTPRASIGGSAASTASTPRPSSRSREPSRDRMADAAGVRSLAPGRAPVPAPANAVVTKLSPLGALMTESLRTPRAGSARRSSVASLSPTPRGQYQPRCDSARSSASCSTNGGRLTSERVSRSTLGDYRNFSMKPRWH